MWKVFQKMLGVKYLINKSTGEVHRINKISGACGVHNMSKDNKWYVTEKKLNKLFLSDYELNGCVHCFKDKDTD
jgi:hypothetical protein